MGSATGKGYPQVNAHAFVKTTLQPSTLGISLAIYRGEKGLSLENSEINLTRGCRGREVNMLEKKKSKTFGKRAENPERT